MHHRPKSIDYAGVYADFAALLEKTNRGITAELQKIESGHRQPLPPEKVPEIPDLISRLKGLDNDEPIHRRLANHIHRDATYDDIYSHMLVAHPGARGIIQEIDKESDIWRSLITSLSIPPSGSDDYKPMVGSPKQVFHARLSRIMILQTVQRAIQPAVAQVGQTTPQWPRATFEKMLPDIRTVTRRFVALDKASAWIDVLGFVWLTFDGDRCTKSLSSYGQRERLSKLRTGPLSTVISSLSCLADSLERASHKAAKRDEITAEAHDLERVASWEKEHGLRALSATSEKQRDYARSIRYRMIKLGADVGEVSAIKTGPQVLRKWESFKRTL